VRTGLPNGVGLRPIIGIGMNGRNAKRESNTDGTRMVMAATRARFKVSICRALIAIIL
jgi:hypothetical protein